MLGSGGSATTRRRRLSAKQRQAVLLTVALVIAVLVAGSLIVLRHHGRVAEDPTAARISLHHRAASSSSPASAAASQPAVSEMPTASPRVRIRSDPLGPAAKAYVAGRAGTVIGAVFDVTSGHIWTLGQGAPQDEASIIKVDILETLLAQHRASGTTLSANDVTLAQEMIEDSDNDAATSLWNEVGGARGISAYNRSAGLTRTRPSGCVTCTGFPWPGWGLSTTTASDQIALLRELLDRNGELSGSEQAFALGLMERVTPSQRWGVASGIAVPTTVALKNGWLPLTSADNDWQINSIGWVSGEGRNYLIAVLSTGNPTEQYGIDTIDGLSAIVWHDMR